MKTLFAWLQYALRLISCTMLVLVAYWLISGNDAIPVIFFPQLFGCIAVATLLEFVLEQIPFKTFILWLITAFLAHYALSFGACILFGWIGLSLSGVAIFTAIFVIIFAVFTYISLKRTKLNAKQINDKLNQK